MFNPFRWDPLSSPYNEPLQPVHPGGPASRHQDVLEVPLEPPAEAGVCMCVCVHGCICVCMHLVVYDMI